MINFLRIVSCLTLAVKGKASKIRRLKSNSNHVESAEFHLLDLTDDLIIYILSYISTAPFECLDYNTPLLDDYNKFVTSKNRVMIYFTHFLHRPDNLYSKRVRETIKREQSNLAVHAFGTITHLLPLVCRKFHSLCNQSDILWKEAMLRLLKHSSPIQWQVALDQWYQRHRVILNMNERMDANLALDNVITACGGGKAAFQSIIKAYQPNLIQAPLVFVSNMNLPLTLMEPMIIQTSEPRYFLMLFELMHRRRDRERLGSFLLEPRPRFLLSVGTPLSLQIGDPIYVVEVLCCTILEDACAELCVIPILKTQLQGLSERPNSNHLFDAKVLYHPEITALMNVP